MPEPSIEPRPSRELRPSHDSSRIPDSRRGRGPSSWLRPAATVTLFALAISLIVTGVGPAYGDLVETRRALLDQENRNLELEQECERLDREADALENDPVAVERAARRHLRMSRVGEFRLR